MLVCYYPKSFQSVFRRELNQGNIDHVRHDKLRAFTLEGSSSAVDA